MSHEITGRELFSQLEQMGIGSTDTLAVHTSLRAAGPIKGGAVAFVQALADYVSNGLLVVPSHTWAGVSPDNPYYNVRTSPACIGVVPQVAVDMSVEDTTGRIVRSMHATHSVVCFGKRAAEYAALDDEACTPTPEQGCFGQLYREKAKILLVGVGLERNTFLHVSEEIAEVPHRLTAEPFEVTLVDAAGRVEQRQIYKHYNPQCAHISENFVKFEEPLRACGGISIGQLGNAKTWIGDAVRMQDEVLRLWRRSGRDLTVDAEPIPKEWY